MNPPEALSPSRTPLPAKGRLDESVGRPGLSPDSHR